MARPRSEAARQRALAAAVDVVLETGIDGFSVEEVVRRSGVAKTTIYRNWPTSQDLLFEALNEIVEPEPEPDTGSLITDVRAFAEYVLSIDDGVIGMHRQMFAGLFAASTTDERGDQLFRRMMDYRRRPVRLMLQRARVRGELEADVDLALAADLLMGPVLFRVFLRGEPFEAEELHKLMAMGLRALRVVP
jgi:AcrR family transcriptional regulator